MEAKKVKPKKGEKRNKKWSPKEIKIILNYLQDAAEIEMPTAQIFYRHLIECSGIDATWDLIRWKVRHLKVLFKKANEWRNSSDAADLEANMGTSCVEAKVLKMCPHYKQLERIFGAQDRKSDFDAVDSGDLVDSKDNIEILNIPLQDTLSFSEDSSQNTSSFDDPLNFPTSTSGIKPANGFAEKKFSKSSAAHLAAYQVEQTKMLKMKIEWEKEKHAKDIALSERKLKLEEEKLQAEIEKEKAQNEIKKRELDLKMQQLKEDQHMKILQLEKDERVQKYEIEMKYKCHLQQQF